jgi:excisionase family DNA binding protein
MLETTLFTENHHGRLLLPRVFRESWTLRTSELDPEEYHEIDLVAEATDNGFEVETIPYTTSHKSTSVLLLNSRRWSLPVRPQRQRPCGKTTRQKRRITRRSCCRKLEGFKMKIFTTGQVAKICACSTHTVVRWFDEGKLGGYVLPGSKDRRIPKNDLAAFMEHNNMPLDNLNEA